MRTAAAEQPRVLSRTRGRVRLLLPTLLGRADNSGQVEAVLHLLPGVRSARASSLTGSVLIHFDPGATSESALVETAAGIVNRRPRAGPLLTPKPGTAASPGGAVVRGVVGHAVVDTALYALAFAEPFGFPAAALGLLHLGFDALVWTAALLPLLRTVPPRQPATAG